MLSRIRGWKFWGVWDARRLTRLGDLALRLIGILAAVAALNLFTLKPSLHVSVSCDDAVDVTHLREAIATQTRNVRRLTLPTEMPPAVRRILNSGEAVKKLQWSSGDPDPGFYAALLFAPTCSPVDSGTWRNAVTVNTRRLRITRATAKINQTVARALWLSAFIEAHATVINDGRGAAKNVRAVPPVGYRPVGANPGEITLRPGERSGLIDFRSNFVDPFVPPATRAGNLFHAFGDDVPTVDEMLLLWIGLGLFLGIFLPAVVATIVRKESTVTDGAADKPRA